MNIKTKLDTAVADLKAYAQTLDASDRPMTPAERTALKAKMTKVEDLKAQTDAADFMRLLAGGSPGPGNLAEQVQAVADGHPGPTSKAAAAWSARVAKSVTAAVGESGVKAISTGGIDTPALIGPVVEKVTPTRILDLITDRVEISGNEFEYIRQSVRTNNAAPVADGAVKPTSVYTFEDESDRVRVFAHLTEPIPLRILADHKDVAAVLERQLAEDTLTALEADVLTGDGTGEHFTGITNAAGVLTQAYTTNPLVTLRKALTKLVKTGEKPTAWVLNFDDLETLDLMREDGATGGFMTGIDEKVFGNLPRIGTSAIPAGTAYLGDWRQLRLIVRENGRLDADVSGELFTKNQLKLRHEGRFGFAVLRPSAFVEVDLTSD